MTALWSDLPLLFQSSATTSGRTCPRERIVRAKRSKRERESARERSDATCSSAGPFPCVGPWKAKLALYGHGKFAFFARFTCVCVGGFVLALPPPGRKRVGKRNRKRRRTQSHRQKKKRTRVEFSHTRERGANRQVKAERRKTMISVTTPPVVCARRRVSAASPSLLTRPSLGRQHPQQSDACAGCKQMIFSVLSISLSWSGARERVHFVSARGNRAGRADCIPIQR